MFRRDVLLVIICMGHLPVNGSVKPSFHDCVFLTVGTKKANVSCPMVRRIGMHGQLAVKVNGENAMAYRRGAMPGIDEKTP